MKKLNSYLLIISIFITILTFTAYSLDDSHVSAQLIFPFEQLAKQNSYEVLIKIDIEDPWHINSNQPL